MNGTQILQFRTAEKAFIEGLCIESHKLYSFEFAEACIQWSITHIFSVFAVFWLREFKN